MIAGGKGSKSRPTQVLDEVLEDNWERIFGKKKAKVEPIATKSDVVLEPPIWDTPPGTRTLHYPSILKQHCTTVIGELRHVNYMQQISEHTSSMSTKLQQYLLDSDGNPVWKDVPTINQD